MWPTVALALLGSADALLRRSGPVYESELHAPEVVYLFTDGRQPDGWTPSSQAALLAKRQPSAPIIPGLGRLDQPPPRAPPSAMPPERKVIGPPQGAQPAPDRKVIGPPHGAAPSDGRKVIAPPGGGPAPAAPDAAPAQQPGAPAQSEPQAPAPPANLKLKREQEEAARQQAKAEQQRRPVTPVDTWQPTALDMAPLFVQVPQAAMFLDDLPPPRTYSAPRNATGTPWLPPGARVIGTGSQTTVEAPQHAPQASKKPLVVFAHYHKTGSVLSGNMMDAMVKALGGKALHLENSTRREYQSGQGFHGAALKSFLMDVPGEEGPTEDASKKLRAGTVRYLRVSNPGYTWKLPALSPARPSLRMVHWVRDPIDLLLSGYRYHKNPDSAEQWEGEPAVCHNCDSDSWNLIFNFEECDFRCNYYDLLNDVPERSGVALEAMLERQELQTMVANLARWGNDPSVIHLSPEHLRNGFDATVSCLMNFFELSVHDQWKLQPVLKELDVTQYSQYVAGAASPSRHVTAGKYDNEGLKQHLLNHPTWGKALRDARATLAKVFARQAEKLNCPSPSA